MRAIRELTQQDGWKTQDGRMTRETVHSLYCYAPFFRHSVVLSVPAVLMLKLPTVRTQKRGKQLHRPIKGFAHSDIFSTSMVRPLIESKTKCSNMIGC